MQPFIPRFARLLLWRGIICVMFGLFTFLWPGITLRITLVLFAFYVLTDGVINIYTSFRHVQHDQDWWFHLFRGIFGVILGVLTLLAPFVTAIVLVWYISAWVLVIGILEIMSAIRLRKKIKGEGWYIAGGILGVLAAILFLAYPLHSALTFTWIVGGYAMVLGITLIVASVRIRRRHVSAV